jgi:integrase
MLSVELGLRAGELASLTTGDLIQPNGQLRKLIVIRKGNRDQSHELRSQEIRSVLVSYCERHLNPMLPAASVFRSQRKGPLTRGSIARLMTALYRNAGILNGSSRSGRRTMLLQGRT